MQFIITEYEGGILLRITYSKMPGLRTLVLRPGIFEMMCSAHEMKLLNFVQEFLTLALHVTAADFYNVCKNLVQCKSFGIYR